MTWVVGHSARSGLACLVPVLVWGCSAGKPLTEDDETGGSTSVAARGGAGAVSAGGSSSGGLGNGGTTAAAGGVPGAGGTSGEGASAGSGAEAGSSVGTGGGAGTGGDAGVGGAVTAGSSGSGMAGAAGGPGICQELSVVPTPQVPVVTILVDTSSSMWETMPPTWPLLYDALMNETDGVVPSLASKVRFGFASYKGLPGMTHTEDDEACAEMPMVTPAYDNTAAIDEVYGPIDWPIDHPSWETPTGHAITRTAAALTAFTPDPPGPKFILLLTDGNPNTCEVLNPQCGQDRSVKAAQDAFAAGVGLFILGVGDIVAQPNNGCPTSARCGVQHLQDMANAGVGAPVHPPSETFVYESCNQGELLATYTADAPAVGTPFTVDTRNEDAKAELISTLTGLLANVISCTVEMDARVTGDPALGMVSVGGSPVAYGGADGWSLDMATLYNVTLQGAACETFKAGATLDIQFPCDPSGKPIAVRR
jgi:hypothetical protein